MITIWLAVGVSFLFNSLNDVNVYCKLDFFFLFCGPEGSMWGSAVCTHTCTVWMCVFRRCVCVFTGLEMAWVQRPPEKVTNGEEFNVSYTVTASDSFYDYAVRNKIFQFRWERLVGSACKLCAMPSKCSCTSTYAYKGLEQILQSTRILHILIFFPRETCQDKRIDQINDGVLEQQILRVLSLGGLDEASSYYFLRWSFALGASKLISLVLSRCFFGQVGHLVS